MLFETLAHGNNNNEENKETADCKRKRVNIGENENKKGLESLTNSSGLPTPKLVYEISN